MNWKKEITVCGSSQVPNGTIIEKNPPCLRSSKLETGMLGDWVAFK